MRTSHAAVALAALVLAAASSPSAPADQNDEVTDFVPHQAIVELKPGHDIADIDRDYGTQTIASIPAERVHLLVLPAPWDEEESIDTLEHDSRIDKAHLNARSDLADGETQGFFYDVLAEDFSGQYAWTVINLTAAQSVSRGEGVVVAVLDTGFDPAHRALAGYDIMPGYDFVDRDDEPCDVGNDRDDDEDGEVDELVGHGTFVLGLVAAVAPEATFLPLRVLDSDGRGQAFHLAEAIFYAIDQGADVINISLGVPREIKLVKETIKRAHESKTVIVAAAGNAGQKDPKRYPAADSKVIGVASTDELDVKSRFSNWGKHLDVSAPGKDLISIMPGNRYARSSGTSLSTALVTGAAALLRSRDPEMKPKDVEKALEEKAVDIDDRNPGFKDHLGKGRLDVLASFDIRAARHDGADLNGDDVVDLEDLLILLAAWGACPPDDECRGDLDESGAVDTVDLIVLLGNWD